MDRVAVRIVRLRPVELTEAVADRRTRRAAGRFQPAGTGKRGRGIRIALLRWARARRAYPRSPPPVIAGEHMDRGRQRASA